VWGGPLIEVKQEQLGKLRFTVEKLVEVVLET
jgi:hypothetical protein